MGPEIFKYLKSLWDFYENQIPIFLESRPKTKAVPGTQIKI